jgi:4-hydroxy-tetrahydrodipicolinate reductase
MKARRLAIVGIRGRMGQELRALASEFKFEVVAGVSSSSNQAIDSIKVYKSIDELDGQAVDIVIDFSLPEATSKVIAWCARFQKPLVSGVTGLSESEKTLFDQAGKKIPVLWAPNTSLGIAVLARMLTHLSKLEGFEFQIEELHHKRKKDKPSGTATFLQSRLTKAVGPQVPEPLAIRGGGIFGIHRIWAMGEEETLTLEHNAMNRRVFARGALKAADWLFDKPAGRYQMDDVLDLPGVL